MTEKAKRPRKAELVAKLLEALESVEATGNIDGDIERMHAAVRAAGFVVSRPPEPSLVALPFKVPSTLEWSVPRQLTRRQQTPRRLERLLVELTSERETTRNRAVMAIGGWDPDPSVDEGLATLLQHDVSYWTRAAAAVSLASRGDKYQDQILDLAEELHTGAHPSPEVAMLERPSESASMALLAAAIIAARSKDVDVVERARLLFATANLPGEEVEVASIWAAFEGAPTA